MSNIKKLMMSAAGGGEALNVEDVFSTYLYQGTGSDQTITNGIDLAGEGGLLWIKNRNNNNPHWLLDSERSNFAARLITNGTQSSYSDSGAYAVPTSTGFTTKGNNANINAGGSGYGYASWTFRKAPKFFDVVTYTGNGVAGRTVSHNLGSVPGCIIVKCTNNTTNWMVYHRGLDVTSPEDKYIRLNMTNALSDSDIAWNDTAPTSTDFTLGSHTLVNGSGKTYVAYLFAHNDGDGGFGLDGDQDIIKCGSYTGNGSPNGPEINLGFEPQWLLYKKTNGDGVWEMFDNMRGFTVDGLNDARLMANYEYSEGLGSLVAPLANGFKLTNNGSDRNAAGGKYIYIAIRRGTKVPESADEAFAIDTKSTPAPAYSSGFPVDMAIQRNISIATSNSVATRLIQQKRLLTDSTDAEENSVTFKFDYSTGYSSDANFNDSNNYSWMWKRAPGFFDVVAYTGNGTGGRTISHNLGVAPEMMWVKPRSGSFMRGWTVYLGPLSTATNDVYAMLNTNAAPGDAPVFYDTAPTDSVFTVSTDAQVNSSSNTYIAYLFATLPGISKVGSYTGNNSSQTIDCGFSSGARFVLIKRTNDSGDWYVWDSVRGILTNTEPSLNLNNTDAELTTDSIDPHSSGFIINQSAQTNVNGAGDTYIFYAIA